MQKIFLRHKISLISLGILSAIILLEIAIRLGGFVFSYLQESRNLASIRQKGAYRIMCLGESTTAGGEDPYPSQLEEILNQRNIGIKFSVINKGVNVINTNYIVSHLEENLNQYNPDMVITMMGGNDMGVQYYEDIQDRDTVLFNKFRTYRLIRTAWKDLMVKLEKTGLYKPKKNEKDAKLALSIPIKKTYKKNPVIIDKDANRATEPNLADSKKYLELGNVYMKEGRFEEAEEAFKKAIGLNRNYSEAYSKLGHLYNRQARFLEAEEFFKKTLGFNGNNEGAYVGLGYCYEGQSRFQEAEQSFKKALELNGKNQNSYLRLGYCYSRQNMFREAEESFKKTLELNPNNDNAYIYLARCYNRQARFLEAEESLKKALQFNPNNPNTYNLYMDLGRVHKEHGRNIQAEEMFKKALALNPNSETAYIELIFLYRDKLVKGYLAEELFTKALALDSLSAWALSELGRFYKDKSMINEAEVLFRRAIAADPRDSESYFRLGEVYLDQGKYAPAEEFFKKAIELEPGMDKAYGGLITIYRERGNKSIETLSNFRLKYYDSLTRDNYLKTKEMLDKRGVRLVCMQYPMRSIEKLKKMFELQEQEQIIFVDNEKIFKDALKNASPRDYFLDLFAGDFGHCTHKGNRLIAENIANVILNKIFTK